MIKKRIAVFSAFVVSLAVGFCFLWQSGDPDYDRASPVEQSLESTGATRGDTKEETEKYYMHIEGETLCAYRLQGEKKTLLKQTAISPEFLPENELETLKEGIYAGSYEELCLYLESYIS